MALLSLLPTGLRARSATRRGMRKFRLALIVAAALPTLSALADSPGSQKPAKQASTGKLLPPKGAGTRNTCTVFGAGYVKIEGTDTCVKVGGAMSVGAGFSSGGH